MRTDPDFTAGSATGDPRRGASQGWMAGPVHIYPVRIYYEDTDVGGVVYHANYLKFAERARTEMLRLIGFPHTEMIERDGRTLAVRRCEADYIRPARFDDSLEVHTDNIDMEAASLWLDQRVKRNGEDLAVLRVRLACIGQNGKPARLPAQLRTALETLANSRRDNGGVKVTATIRERV